MNFRHAVLRFLLGAIVAFGAIAAGAEPIEWPIAEGGNGHFYELTTGLGVYSWSDQHRAVQLLTYGGWRGHLATITNLAELEWISDHLFVPQLPIQSVVFLGGWNDGFLVDSSTCESGCWTLGSWHWITGETWDFASWAPEEPSTGENGCTSEFALSYLYHWEHYFDRTGFNNLPFEYGVAGAARLVEYDDLQVVDQPPLDHPVAVQQSTWGHVKALYR